MKSPPHSTLHATCTEQSLKAAKPARINWIAAVLERLYQRQRRQSMKVIRGYQRFLGSPNNGTEAVRAAAEDPGDTGL